MKFGKNSVRKGSPDAAEPSPETAVAAAAAVEVEGIAAAAVAAGVVGAGAGPTWCAGWPSFAGAAA